MGDVRVTIDGTDLDNGSWRHIVDWPSVIRSDDGAIEKFAIEFVVEADTAAQMDTRFESTYYDLTKKNPRLKVWLDDATTPPTLDWYPGDGVHLETLSIVSMVPELSRTQKKVHFALVVSCNCEVPMPNGGGGPASDLGSTIQGLTTNIEVVKNYFGSDLYTLTASGQFVQTLNESAEGPFTLDSVSDNSGKARFTISGGSIAASFDTGMFIDVSSPSDYEGRHFVTAISGGGTIIDTDTDFGSIEGAVSASVLLGTTTTAEDNFQNGKSQILVNLLETGTGGDPSSTDPYMVKIAETVSFSSEKKDALQFVLGSAPSSLLLTTQTGAGRAVERGLQYNIRFVGPVEQDTGFAPRTQGIIIEGRCSITKLARDENTLHKWWKDIEEELIGAAETINSQRFGGGLRWRNTEAYIDYATNDVQFSIVCVGNYTGTISYSATESFSEQVQRTAWGDTEGTDHIQEAPGANRKVGIVRVNWLGDAGGTPPVPKAPTESGYTYLFDSSNVVRHENLEDESGYKYDSVGMEFYFTRYKLKQGGGSGGGRFNDKGYFVPTSPDI